MTDRELDIRRIMTTCRHFNGVQHTECHAGVVYTDLFGRQVGWAKHLLCLGDEKSTVTCAKMSMPDRAEAEKQADEYTAHMTGFLTAVVAAHKHAEEAGLGIGHGGVGQIPCPVEGCGGTLHYSVAGVNGHMHGKCSGTCGTAWME